VSLGNDKKPGGLGAILMQIKKNGEHCVIAYASRKLQKHECNYTPFLLEMQAAIWGMEHFSTYLRGRKFTLYALHRPSTSREIGQSAHQNAQQASSSYEHF
jgi:hypothetical protein